MESVNPLQSAMQRKASRLPVGTKEEFMFRRSSERVAGVKKTVAGIKPQMPYGSIERSSKPEFSVLPVLTFRGRPSIIYVVMRLPA